MDLAVCSHQAIGTEQGHTVVIDLCGWIYFWQRDRDITVVACRQLLKTLSGGARNRLHIRCNLCTRGPAITRSCHFWQDDNTCIMPGCLLNQSEQVANILFFLAERWLILNCGNSVSGEG